MSDQSASEAYLKDSSNFSNSSLDDTGLQACLLTFFIRQRLSKCSLNSLEQILATNLNSYLTDRSQQLANSLACNETTAETKCLFLVDVIDVVYDYLKPQIDVPANFEQFGHFFLTTTRVCSFLLGYLKVFTPSSNDIRWIIKGLRKKSQERKEN